MPPILDHDLYRRLARSRDLLADSNARPLLADAAAVACLSKYHYLRQFHRAFGETPHHFLQRRRIELARHLLTATGLPVTDICLTAGYESLGTFSSLFHGHTGSTPTAYRAATRRELFAIRWAPTPPAIPFCFLSAFGIPDPQF
jgi:AraC-like DNA-binding protein